MLIIRCFLMFEYDVLRTVRVCAIPAIFGSAIVLHLLILAPPQYSVCIPEQVRVSVLTCLRIPAR